MAKSLANLSLSGQDFYALRRACGMSLVVFGRSLDYQGTDATLKRDIRRLELVDELPAEVVDRLHQVFSRAGSTGFLGYRGKQDLVRLKAITDEKASSDAVAAIAALFMEAAKSWEEKPRTTTSSRAGATAKTRSTSRVSSMSRRA